MTALRSDIGILAHALRVVARDIRAPDNAPALAIGEAAAMLDDLAAGIAAAVQILASGGEVIRSGLRWSLQDAHGKPRASGITAVVLMLDLAEKLKHAAPGGCHD